MMQQGREQLDADWNEQTAIVLEAIRTVARDLLGPHGTTDDGFRITRHADADGRPQPWDVLIGRGSYYVGGIRCENPEAVSLRAIAAELPCDDEPAGPGRYLAYLDTWDRVMTAADDPNLIDPALGGSDTSVRLQVVWRVRLLTLEGGIDDRPERLLADTYARRKLPGMRARVDPKQGYAGSENHLYRVEIHRAGVSRDASFKWSRDNGSVVAAVTAFDGDRIVVRPGDAETRFEAGTWAEPADEITAMCERVPPLIRIEATDDGRRLTTSPAWPLETERPLRRTIRRWDHGEQGRPDAGGGVPVDERRWIDLEDGIQVSFDGGGEYRSGDSWVFPARPAEGGIEWPGDPGEPSWIPPDGVAHHRAPLALLDIDRDGALRVAKDLRRAFEPLSR